MIQRSKHNKSLQAQDSEAKATSSRRLPHLPIPTSLPGLVLRPHLCRWRRWSLVRFERQILVLELDADLKISEKKNCKESKKF